MEDIRIKKAAEHLDNLCHQQVDSCTLYISWSTIYHHLSIKYAVTTVLLSTKHLLTSVSFVEHLDISLCEWSFNCSMIYFPIFTFITQQSFQFNFSAVCISQHAAIDQGWLWMASCHSVLPLWVFSSIFYWKLTWVIHYGFQLTIVPVLANMKNHKQCRYEDVPATEACVATKYKQMPGFVLPECQTQTHLWIPGKVRQY